jgi:hypothetical protein
MGIGEGCGAATTRRPQAAGRRYCRVPRHVRNRTEVLPAADGRPLETPRATVVEVIEGQRCRGGSLTVEPLATGDRLIGAMPGRPPGRRDTSRECVSDTSQSMSFGTRSALCLSDHDASGPLLPASLSRLPRGSPPRSPLSRSRPGKWWLAALKHGGQGRTRTVSLSPLHP